MTHYISLFMVVWWQQYISPFNPLIPFVFFSNQKKKKIEKNANNFLITLWCKRKESKVGKIETKKMNNKNVFIFSLSFCCCCRRWLLTVKTSGECDAKKKIIFPAKNIYRIFMEFIYFNIFHLFAGWFVRFFVRFVQCIGPQKQNV